MALKIIKGNIFKTQCNVVVNTVNCVGIMGAGIALEFRLRYPEMYEKYVALCATGKLDIGLLWLYEGKDRKVLNFPTKKHWKNPSKPEYLHAGLKKFTDTYNQKGIESIAFPLLGADRGGLGQEESLKIMKIYLEKLDIDVEIYLYDPQAEDDLFELVREKLLSSKEEHLLREMKLKKNAFQKVIAGFQDPEIRQLNQLARVEGLGIKTLEAVFAFATSSSKQLNLFK